MYEAGYEPFWCVREARDYSVSVAKKEVAGTRRAGRETSGLNGTKNGSKIEDPSSQ